MSGTNPASGRDDPIARQVRPLPSAPSLEFERKEAKAFLKQIRAGDADALRRVELTHPVSLRDRKPNEIQLADAQHVIAREYGFSSWPRLVEYFEEMERHRNSPRFHGIDYDDDRLEQLARSIVRRHQRADPVVVRQLAHFVPRFYARPAAESLATPITDDEARLVVAREHHRVSWEELIERAGASRAWRDQKTWENDSAPFARARRAMRDHDIDALASILDEHPELLAPPMVEREWRMTLGSTALSIECDAKTADARRVTDFIASRGVDIQRELNERLLGWPDQERHQPERIRWYLDRGADPNWLPPNGITILEHAIVRHKDPSCVDLIAERVTPRRALWIAAGLGDVASVKSFIAGKGTLKPEGRLNRPDTIAMGSFLPPGLPLNHDADDLEIMWEAFRIAGWNQRWDAMDALLGAGLPVDHAPIVWPLLLEAVGTWQIPLAEYLVSRGADLDREWPQGGSPRKLVRRLAMDIHDPHTEEIRRLLSICGAGTLDEILAEREAKRQSPPPPEERTLRAMQLAADDAARQGQSVVTTENMLVGLLRVEGGIFAQFFMGTGTDMQKLRVMIGARLLADTDPLVGQDLPADADAAAAVSVAATEADSRRRTYVSPGHLLWGIITQHAAPGARLLAEVGAAEPRALERLKAVLYI